MSSVALQREDKREAGRPARRSQGKQVWDAEDLSWTGVAVGTQSKAGWSCEGRVDKPGDI